MGIETHGLRARLVNVVSLPRRVMTGAPLTTAYALVLLVSTIVLRHVSTAEANRLLDFSSTDVAHLGRDPFVVLVLSAVWLPGQVWLPYVVVLLVVAAPLERRIGTARLALGFISGHVLATLLTELPIAAAITGGWLPAASAHRIDVGASYGLLTVVAAYAGSVSLLRGLGTLMLAWVLVAGFAVSGQDMSTYGHAFAVVIGICWWPLLYGRARRLSARGATPGEVPDTGAAFDILGRCSG